MDIFYHIRIGFLYAIEAEGKDFSIAARQQLRQKKVSRGVHIINIVRRGAPAQINLAPLPTLAASVFGAVGGRQCINHRRIHVVPD